MRSSEAHNFRIIKRKSSDLIQKQNQTQARDYTGLYRSLSGQGPPKAFEPHRPAGEFPGAGIARGADHQEIDSIADRKCPKRMIL